MNVSVGDLQNWTNGVLLFGREDESIESIAIDSRNLRDGACFLALSGENTDGHLFIDAAYQAGAAACIVSDAFFRDKEVPSHYHNLIIVPDTLLALRDIARGYRTECDIPVEHT